MKKCMASVLVSVMMFGSVALAINDVINYEILWEGSNSVLTYYQTLIDAIRKQYETYGDISDADFETFLIALAGYTNERGTKTVTGPIAGHTGLRDSSFEWSSLMISNFSSIAEYYRNGESDLSETMDGLLRIYDALNPKE